jgi:hypothetical protein
MANPQLEVEEVQRFLARINIMDFVRPLFVGSFDQQRQRNGRIFGCQLNVNLSAGREVPLMTEQQLAESIAQVRTNGARAVHRGAAEGRGFG